MHSEIKKIGILGGSFNPAHEGHIYISNSAKNILGLDEVWWLVCPKNPFKSAKDLETLENRVIYAQELTLDHDFIKISDYEKKFDKIRTIDTLKSLTKEYNENKFVWLMGADNLPEFHNWYEWHKIVSLLPIAIFSRENYLNDIADSCLYKIYEQSFVSDPAQLMVSEAPSWSVLNIKNHPASSTKIRQAF